MQQRHRQRCVAICRARGPKTCGHSLPARPAAALAALARSGRAWRGVRPPARCLRRRCRRPCVRMVDRAPPPGARLAGKDGRDRKVFVVVNAHGSRLSMCLGKHGRLTPPKPGSYITDQSVINYRPPADRAGRKASSMRRFAAPLVFTLAALGWHVRGPRHRPSPCALCARSTRASVCGQQHRLRRRGAGPNRVAPVVSGGRQDGLAAGGPGRCRQGWPGAGQSRPDGPAAGSASGQLRPRGRARQCRPGEVRI